ncbi:MAG: tetratricopeptide repeat protein [Deltaproteobacteria bacterium]|uniref:Tetratricopeptide repeat protein n=1 Tax=Candidatus Zymogenus saltonus TaxID=2844893 RepID=A0A9D8PP04_9DELT|nr:tetratricopeptide repeat protein [Candidatus Zymogenus saltonus]
MRIAETGRISDVLPDEFMERKEFYKRSLDLFLLMIEAQPVNPPAWGHIGLLLYELGRFDKSLGYFAMINEVEPNNAVALDARGFIEMERGNFKSAVSHFERVVEISPKRHDVASDLALCLYHVGRYDDLRSLLDASVGKMMGVKEYFLLGKSADALGEESSAHYKKCIDLYTAPAGPVREAQYACLNAMRGAALSMTGDGKDKSGEVKKAFMEAARRAGLTDPDRMILSAFDLTFKARGKFIREIKDHISRLDG